MAKKAKTDAAPQDETPALPRVRVLVSIASDLWSFVPGDVVEPEHAHYDAAVALARGPNAVLLDADGAEYREAEIVPPGTLPGDDPGPPKADGDATDAPAGDGLEAGAEGTASDETTDSAPAGDAALEA